MTNSGPKPPASDSPDPQADWRSRVEAIFEAWGFFVVRNRWVALAAALISTAWMASLLPGVTVDNSTEAFLLPDDPEVLFYNAFREEFERDDRVLIAIEAPEIFDLDFLERLRDFHEAIEREVPHIDEVDSLLNARVTRGDGDELIVEDLLESFPANAAELVALREFVLSNPVYRNAYVSGNGRLAAISVKPTTWVDRTGGVDELDGFNEDTDGGGEQEVAQLSDATRDAAYLTSAEGDAVVNALLELADQRRSDDFKIYLAGALVVTHRINESMTTDFIMLMPASIAMMAIVLALLFRRIGGVLLPLIVVVFSLITTLGVMVLLEIPGSTAVQILPVFLLTVGICDAVHILALVYRRCGEGLDRETAVARALGHSGLPVLMTSVTTAAGMSSFVTAEMAAVMHLGILAPIGVMLAFVYTMVMLPAAIAIFPMSSRPQSGASFKLPFEGMLVAAGTFATRSPSRVLVPAVLLIVLALLGALQTQFSHNGLKWFPEDDRLPRDMAKLDETFAGSVSVEILIDSGRPGGLYEPELMKSIERISRRLEQLPIEPIFIDKVMSIVDILEETHQALNENRAEMRRVPDSRDLIAQELLLFENSGSDDTQEWVDSEFRKARINVRVPFVDALLYPSLVADINAMVTEELDGLAEFRLTGLMKLLAEIFDAVIRSMMKSYAYALIVITPLMMLLLGSLRRGLISMVPNLIPVVATLGIMGWLGLALDSTTIIVGAMVIGLAVDDTIHFMHKFHGYYEKSGDLEGAVQETLRTTGSALLFTTLVLTLGFAIFGVSGLMNIRIFGLLSAMAATVAFLADLLVAPALLAVVEARRRPKVPHGGVG